MSEMEKYIKAIAPAIDHIAFTRRMGELSDLDMEEFDKRIDELCTKYHNLYGDMNEMQIALHGITEVIRAGKGEELFEDLMNSMKD